MAVCCVFLRVSETISFAISFQIAIVESDCQLIHDVKYGAEQEWSRPEWSRITPE